MSAARRLIVAADDFGLSAGVNAGIIRAHRDGILTDASLMVNGQGFAEAVELARAHPTLNPGWARASSTAAANARPFTIRLVSVRMPSRWARMMPALTPADMPKSSAATIRRRTALTAPPPVGARGGGPARADRPSTS